MGFIGQLVSGSMQMKQAKLAGRQQEADIARQTAQRQSDESEDFRTARGTFIAGSAKGGVNMGGTPMDVLANLERRHAQNKKRIKEGGEAQARRSRAETQAATIQGVGNILSGVGGLATSFVPGGIGNTIASKVF